MKLRAGALSAFVPLFAFLWSDCTPTQPTPPGNTIIIGGDQITIGGTPGTTPSQGSGSCLIDRVRVGFFGISCPAGVSPRNGQGVLPIGCVGSDTCTPKRKDGSDATIGEHGTAIRWAASPPERVRLAEVEEAFNRNVIPVALGEVQVSATIAPQACGEMVGIHSFQVTAATSSTTGEVVALSMPQVGDELDFYRNDGKGEGDFVWTHMGKLRVGDPIPKAWRDRGSR